GAPPSIQRLRRRRLWIPGLAALVVVLLVVLLTSGGGSKKLVPGGGSAGNTYDPLAYDSGKRAQFERDAAAGLSHVLYAKSPGGAIATARRVAAFRPQIQKAAAAGHADPNVLEGIVFVESAGNPDVIAGRDPANASGLTQILAQTGQSLLGMKIDLARSRFLTKRIRTAQRHHKSTKKLLAARRKVDPRFDPAQALAATTRYLAFARGKLHRDDLAVVSYHMGVGNLQSVEAAYGTKAAPYAELYFDSTPLVHPPAYRLLARFGDDSSNYYWKVLAAEQIMRLYRTDPAELARVAALQRNKASAEEVLHPRASTRVFSTPASLRRAEQSGQLRPLPSDPAKYGFAIDPGMGSMAPRLGQRPSQYRSLRPEALGALAYIAAGVRKIGGSKQPLVVTSTVRDGPYQRALVKTNIEATHAYSLHTTGYAFDIERSYASRAQALAFQFMLDRLTALNLIAWAREPRAIHVTVSSAARPLASLVPR
ncbi:MAG: transglycosylase SLT domain-containing protein, partial [Thermoleophilaceae bacterium]